MVYGHDTEESVVAYYTSEVSRLKQKKADSYLTISEESTMSIYQGDVSDYHKCKRDTLVAKSRQEKQAKKPGVKIGMTSKQVINDTKWGKPDEINRTTTQYQVSEQWVYGNGNYLYFENGVLTTIQN